MSIRSEEFGKAGRCYIQRNSCRTEGIYLSIEVDPKVNVSINQLNFLSCSTR